MQINDELVAKLANLAKLEFDPTETEAIKTDLAQIIGFFEQINVIDTEGVEPLVYLNDATNTLRPDVATQLLTREQALQNAPLRDDAHILVPKVIKKGG